MSYISKLDSVKKGIGTILGEGQVPVELIERQNVAMLCTGLAAATAREMLAQKDIFVVDGYAFHFEPTGNGNKVRGKLSVYKIVDSDAVPGYGRN